MSSIPTLADALAGKNASEIQKIGRGRIVRPLDDDDEGDVRARPIEPRLARAPSHPNPQQEPAMSHTHLHDGILEQLAKKAPLNAAKLATALKTTPGAIKAACQELSAAGKIHSFRGKGHYPGPASQQERGGSREKKRGILRRAARPPAIPTAGPKPASADEVNFLIDDVGKLSIVTADARVDLSSAATKRLAQFIDKTKTFRA